MSEPERPFTVRLKHWHAVAEWRWDVNDETCGICRNPFNGCAPGVKYPGDDCPPGTLPPRPRPAPSVREEILSGVFKKE